MGGGTHPTCTLRPNRHTHPLAIAHMEASGAMTLQGRLKREKLHVAHERLAIRDAYTQLSTVCMAQARLLNRYERAERAVAEATQTLTDSSAPPQGRARCTMPFTCSSTTRRPGSSFRSNLRQRWVRESE
jgi:hypothetical protein